MGQLGQFVLESNSVGRSIGASYVFRGKTGPPFKTPTNLLVSSFVMPITVELWSVDALLRKIKVSQKSPCGSVGINVVNKSLIYNGLIVSQRERSKFLQKSTLNSITRPKTTQMKTKIAITFIFSLICDKK